LESLIHMDQMFTTTKPETIITSVSPAPLEQKLTGSQ